jgi:hypothetical protein
VLVAETAPRPQVRRGQQPPRIGVLRTPIDLEASPGSTIMLLDMTIIRCDT